MVYQAYDMYDIVTRAQIVNEVYLWRGVPYAYSYVYVRTTVRTVQYEYDVYPAYEYKYGVKSYCHLLLNEPPGKTLMGKKKEKKM